MTQRSYDIAPEDAAPHVVVTNRITPMGAEFAIEAADDTQQEKDDDNSNRATSD